jgi:hypothetical protein
MQALREPSSPRQLQPHEDEDSDDDDDDDDDDDNDDDDYHDYDWPSDSVSDDDDEPPPGTMDEAHAALYSAQCKLERLSQAVLQVAGCNEGFKSERTEAKVVA